VTPIGIVRKIVQLFTVHQEKYLKDGTAFGGPLGNRGLRKLIEKLVYGLVSFRAHRLLRGSN